MERLILLLVCFDEVIVSIVTSMACAAIRSKVEKHSVFLRQNRAWRLESTELLTGWIHSREVGSNRENIKFTVIDTMPSYQSFSSNQWRNICRTNLTPSIVKTVSIPWRDSHELGASFYLEVFENQEDFVLFRHSNVSQTSRVSIILVGIVRTVYSTGSPVTVNIRDGNVAVTS